MGRPFALKHPGIAGAERQQLPWKSRSVRLLGKYEMIDGVYGCWEWRDSISHEGYGILYEGNGDGSRATHVVMAHRALYEIYRGPVPAGMDLDHLCRNRACVNPAHLEACSRAENLRRGAGAKVSLNQVRAMRRERDMQGTSYRKLGKKYGISSTHARAICLREKWAA